MKLSRTILFALCVALSLSGAATADDHAAEHFFETQVRPLLARRCLECHGPDKQQGGLRLDSRAAMLAGVDGTPAMVPGQPKESRLLQVLQYEEDDTVMPPDGKLPDEEIALLTKWISAGGNWPAAAGPDASNQLGKYPLTPDGEIDFAAAAESHWAYQPIRKTVPPQVRATDRVQSPIDRFLLTSTSQPRPTPPGSGAASIRSR